MYYHGKLFGRFRSAMIYCLLISVAGCSTNYGNTWTDYEHGSGSGQYSNVTVYVTKSPTPSSPLMKVKALGKATYEYNKYRNYTTQWDFYEYIFPVAFVGGGTWAIYSFVNNQDPTIPLVVGVFGALSILILPSKIMVNGKELLPEKETKKVSGVNPISGNVVIEIGGRKRTFQSDNEGVTSFDIEKDFQVSSLSPEQVPVLVTVANLNKFNTGIRISPAEYKSPR